MEKDLNKFKATRDLIDKLSESSELKKIGYEGLIKSLKKEKYEPVGVHNPHKFILQLTAPNKKRF